MLTLHVLLKVNINVTIKCSIEIGHKNVVFMCSSEI